jgi:hypothetical protein
MRRNREYLTKTEATEYLGVEKWAPDELRHHDLGPSCIEMGKKIRYLRGDIFDWGLRTSTGSRLRASRLFVRLRASPCSERTKRPSRCLQ